MDFPRAYPRAHRWLAPGVALALGLAALPALAQPSLRSTFPGRRIGGGTRGECSARLLANLVPASSVYAPGSSRLLGILQGPTANPRPVLISFRPEASASSASGSSTGKVITLPASPTGIVLFPLPEASSSLPLRWESTFQCDGGAAPATEDPLAFVSSSSPPALSLLVKDVSAEDRKLQQSLQTLYKACGKTVSRQVVAQSFGLADAIKDDWPSELTVTCRS